MTLAPADVYAIVVGINVYPGFPRRDLGSAVGDASRFAGWLIEAHGGEVAAGGETRRWEEENLWLITSPEARGDGYDPASPYDAEPIKHQVDRALYELHRRRRGNGPLGKRLYFYFAGHGCGASFDQTALIMANATRRSLRQNVGVAPYQRHLVEEALFEEVVFFLDCCREFADTAVPQQPDRDTRPRVGAPEVRYARFHGAKYRGRAYEAPAAGGADETGIFTDVLLRGLRGAAAGPGGEITGSSLWEYLDRAVPEEARRRNREQEPDYGAGGGAEVVFRTGVGPPEVAARIRAPEGWTGRVALLDGTHRELATFEASAPLHIDLPPGLYSLRGGERRVFFNLEAEQGPVDVRYL